MTDPVEKKVFFEGQQCLVTVDAQNGQKIQFLTNSLWLENPDGSPQTLVVNDVRQVSPSAQS